MAWPRRPSSLSRSCSPWASSAGSRPTRWWSPRPGRHGRGPSPALALHRPPSRCSDRRASGTGASTPRRRSIPRRRPSCRRSWPRSSASAAAGIGPWIGTGAGSTPVYRVGPNQPRVRVRLDRAAIHGGRALQRALAAVPIPRDARPATGSDHHMTIVQASTDTLWELFGAHRDAGRWHARWGGAIRHVSTSPGYYTASAWPGATRNWGATASSLPIVGGTILLDELKRGRIGHALAINLPAPRAGVFSWPAQRTDGTGPATALPEGARLRLDPTRGRRLPGPAQGDPDDRAGGPALRPRGTRPDPSRDLALRRGPARVGRKALRRVLPRPHAGRSCSRRSHGIACRSCRCTCARGPRAVIDRPRATQARGSRDDGPDALAGAGPRDRSGRGAALATSAYVAYGRGFVNGDAMWALTWGKQLAHLHQPTFSAGTPTPHPLVNATTALLSILGPRCRASLARHRLPLARRAALRDLAAWNDARRACHGRARGRARRHPRDRRVLRTAGLPGLSLRRPGRLGGRTRGALAATGDAGARPAHRRRIAAARGLATRRPVLVVAGAVAQPPAGAPGARPDRGGAVPVGALRPHHRRRPRLQLHPHDSGGR